MNQQSNPETTQDRAFDLWDTWQRHGCVMFRQQRRIYEMIALQIKGTVLDVGCGNGIGTAILESESNRVGRGEMTVVQGSDKLPSNVQFAGQLYSWLTFFPWDVQKFNSGEWGIVVCVEVLEHVADPLAAMRNLLAATRVELWLSTPNGTGKPKPPSNPHHVAEYTPFEVVKLIADASEGRSLRYQVLGWEDFEPVPMDTLVDPLVYRVTLL